MKDAGLRIRVQRELREAFLAACQAQDKPAAQVLREFMRAYVAEHADKDGSDSTPQEGSPSNKKRADGPAR
jgi:hypothetical protein